MDVHVHDVRAKINKKKIVIFFVILGPCIGHRIWQRNKQNQIQKQSAHTIKCFSYSTLSNFLGLLLIKPNPENH
jgi:predicted negative regulator of RcsB-dependent stress response